MDAGSLDERPVARVGVSSSARVSFGRSATRGLTTSQTRRAAISLAFLPAAATVV